MRKKLRPIYLLAAFLVLAQALNAQTDDEVIRIDTQLVEVPVSVRTRDGRILSDLKKSDFVLFEDDKLQEIAEFTSSTAPFEVIVVLDTSGSTRNDLALIRRAAADFMAGLKPVDQVGLISFKTERTETMARAVADVRQSLTSDRAILENALNALETTNSTPLYDALSAAAARGGFESKPSSGKILRRAVVVLTDGVDSISDADFEDVRRAFQNSQLAVYFIKLDTRDAFEDQLLGDCSLTTRFSVEQIRRYYDVFYPQAKVEKTFDFCRLGEFEKLAISKGLYQIADREMNELSKITGGRVFPVSGLTAARAAFRTVAAELGTQYSLGYYSKNTKSDGTFRRIRVEVRRSGATVTTREGYIR